MRSNIYVSVARRASLGAIMFEKFNCFSGGGAPTDPRIITESPERTYKTRCIDKYANSHNRLCQLQNEIEKTPRYL